MLLVALTVVSVGANRIQAATTSNSSNASSTHLIKTFEALNRDTDGLKVEKIQEMVEKMRVSYWDIFSKYIAFSTEVYQYRKYYVSAYNLAKREYTTIPAIRVLTVVTSANASSSCATCAPSLDITWRASNISKIRIDLVSTSTSAHVNLASSTPNDGMSSVQLNIPDNQPDGKYYLVLSSAEGNLTAIGKSLRPIIILKSGVATIYPYKLKPSFKLVEEVQPQDPTSLRAESDALYKKENPDKFSDKKGDSKSEDGKKCSTMDIILKKPLCVPGSNSVNN